MQTLLAILHTTSLKLPEGILNQENMFALIHTRTIMKGATNGDLEA